MFLSSQLAHYLRSFRKLFLIYVTTLSFRDSEGTPAFLLGNSFFSFLFFFQCQNSTNASSLNSPENFPLISQLPGNMALCLDSSLSCSFGELSPVRGRCNIRLTLRTSLFLGIHHSNRCCCFLFFVFSPSFTYFYNVSTSTIWNIYIKWVIFFWKKSNKWR